MTSANARVAEFPIDEMFLNRWSVRAFSDEGISDYDLMSIFETARWAPSAYNSQPWRFTYAKRGDAHWEELLGLLNEFNCGWAKHAAALAVLISKETLTDPRDGIAYPARNHSFDAGAAWAQLALGASLLGWQAHCMAGFDDVAALKVLQVPPGYRVEVAIAIGRASDTHRLPEDLREREVPSLRNPSLVNVFDGAFGEQ